MSSTAVESPRDSEAAEPQDLDATRPALSIRAVNKTYANGFRAVKDVDLEIPTGEIFALLGPNGAGKTTLISIICGLVNKSAGEIHVNGHDIIRDYREARSLIGLVPQELATDSFESVWATVSFSRGLFGKKKDPDYVEKVLKDLSLWEKRNDRILSLSGGMKRRVMIAKALAHEPRVLFLDEPTAGVDVELRRDMWNTISGLRDTGVTIILTTHYIEEAEEMADRVGVINQGELILVDETEQLMQKLGRKQLTIQLEKPIQALPPTLNGHGLQLESDGRHLTFDYNAATGESGINELLKTLSEAGLSIGDLNTTQSSLEDIFLDLVKR